MEDRPKLLYIVVQDNEPESLEAIDKHLSIHFRYTRTVLQNVLQLMGCKPRHAFKVSKRVFSIFENEALLSCPEGSISLSSRCLYAPNIYSSTDCLAEEEKRAVEDENLKSNEIQEQEVVYKKCGTTVVSRDEFVDVVCDVLSAYRYVGPNQRGDLLLACRVRERKTSMTILLCGTSGCGKSTLSSLLASRLGITTVVSTDSIRHMMRSFVDEKDNPLLWASTYHAGNILDPVAVAEAKAKKKAKDMDSITLGHLMEAHSSTTSENFADSFNEVWDSRGKEFLSNEAGHNEGDEMAISSKEMVVQGYKAQSEMVIDSLDRLVSAWEQKCESVVVEGVHLSLNFVMELMKKHPSIIPFMIYISNEEKHLERFAVRAKYMTLDPAKNKYAKYICNIRTIQDYVCKRAEKHLVPKVNNTNVDRSIAAIHATIFGCLRRREGGELLYDPVTNTVKMVDEEYRNQCAADSFGSKGMLQLLQRKGSSRQLMALVNTDGSVARAWPFESD